MSLDHLFADRGERQVETGSIREFGFKQKAQGILEMHRVPKFKQEKTLLQLASADKDYYRQTAATGADRTHLDVVDWLPFCAEKYNISANLSDYVIVPVPIVPSDIPNRNLVAFPFKTLSDFDPHLKMMQYRSWKAAPTHIEHINKDYTIAKGVVFDVSLQRMRNSLDEVWKVVALCGFDRTKDKLLANAILTGERDEYSMGAYTGGYTCSCCNAASGRPGEMGCNHLEPNRRQLRVFEVQGQPTLAYNNVESFQGFEISSVADAAFKGAKNPKLIDMS